MQNFDLYLIVFFYISFFLLQVSVLCREVESTRGLTVDDCLAMRVGLLETKGKYTEQYQFFKAKGETSLKPPSALDNPEASYMPGSARFGMMDAASYIHHTPVKPHDMRMENWYQLVRAAAH